MLKIMEELKKHYESVSRLSSGSFGVTYKVFDEKENYAVKVINTNQRNALREIYFIKSVASSSPFLTPVNKYWTEGKQIFLEMPLAKQNLKEFLQTKEFYLYTERQVENLICQIICGLNTIHQSGFGHFDLKPENILVFEENDTQSVKIADFGFVNKIDSTCFDSLESLFSLPYRAPEVDCLTVPALTFQFDIWSLGCVIYEILVSHAFRKEANLISQLFPVNPFPPNYKLRGVEFANNWLKWQNLPTVKTCSKFIESYTFGDSNYPKLDEMLKSAENEIKGYENIKQVIESCLNVTVAKRPTTQDLLEFFPEFECLSFEKELFLTKNDVKESSDNFLKLLKFFTKCDIDTEQTWEIMQLGDTVLSRLGYFAVFWNMDFSKAPWSGLKREQLENKFSVLEGKLKGKLNQVQKEVLEEEVEKLSKIIDFRNLLKINGLENITNQFELLDEIIKNL